MAQISFIMAKNPKWWGWLGCKMIQAAEDIDVSHAATMIRSTDDIVYESVFPLSREIPFREWMKTYHAERIYSFDIPPGVEPFLRAQIKTLTKKPYSVLQLLRIGMGILNKWLDQKFDKMPLNGDRYLICTEMSARILVNWFGVDFGQDLDGVGLRDLEHQLQILKAKEAAGGNVWVSGN